MKSQRLSTPLFLEFAVTLVTFVAFNVLATVRYVDVNSTNSTSPYTSWATAATNIQDAVDAAVAGDEIVVTNGIYATGGRATVADGTTNRVAVEKPLTLRSVNGPQFTIIDGGQSVRCVYLTNGASLYGFTLTNGWIFFGDGVGVLCKSQSAMVTNCVIAGNSSLAGSGSGACGGTLNNCRLTGNSAHGWHGNFALGGGAYGSTLNNCALTGNYATRGGGAVYCTLNNCTLIDNSAEDGGGTVACTLNNCTLTSNSAGNGGGAWYGTLNNCTLTGNSAFSGGGGAFGCTLNNCTLTGNSANHGGGADGICTLNNCIVYFNTAVGGANYDSYSILNYSCTTPLPTNGVGNITNAPLVVELFDGSLRLQSNSPCINAGLNALAPAGPDLVGNLRIVRGTVDIGAYEFQGLGSVISYAWLQRYALPTDGSADTADPDGDRLNNWQEWHCATDPTNALSVLRLLAPVIAGTDVTVTWQSAAGENYFLNRSPTISSGFTTLARGIAGQTGTTSYTDTNAVGTEPWFYRVGVVVEPQDQPCLGPSPGPEYQCVNGVWTHVGDGRL